MTDLRYPIGPEATGTSLADAIRDLEESPALLRQAVRGLDAAQLDTAYRPEGWTLRQVVNHLASSHAHGYTRCHFTLVEDTPEVRGYHGELPDAAALPIEIPLNLFDALQCRLVALFRSLTPEQWSRTFRHSQRGLMTVEQLAVFLAWHARHHTVHITSLRERMGWKAFKPPMNADKRR
ncbi:MAG TPA: putative metal-dependent hydrolase [Bryobacteraceae bacterium]|nr:putative metal-dependent hydrolase [Bryobacteraceae bacterium]